MRMLLSAGITLLICVFHLDRTDRNRRSWPVNGLFVGLSGCEGPFLTTV